MKKIIINICFILIALTAVASVCACDANNCTEEVDLSGNNVENITVDEITDEVAVDGITDEVAVDGITDEVAVDRINQITDDAISVESIKSKNHTISLSKEAIKIKEKIEDLQSLIITDFNTTESDYINLHIETYKPHGVTPELVDFVADDYGTKNINLMAFIYGVTIGEVIDTIHEIKLGKHGSYLKNLFEEIDNKNYQEIAELKIIYESYLKDSIIQMLI